MAGQLPPLLRWSAQEVFWMWGRIARVVRSSVRRLFPSPSIDEMMAAAIERHRNYGSVIGPNTKLYGQLDGVNPHLISIGDYCVIGVQSAVLTHCPIRGARPVVIGDYVWIGFNALVLPGVTIADGCVIGAGSVVTHDIPAGVIAAGCPARVLRSLSEAEKESLISRLRSGDPMR